MAIDPIGDFEALKYKPGLNKVEEAVISSHFMEAFARDRRLQLYEPNEFSSKQMLVDSRVIYETLLPTLLDRSRRFAQHRANIAGRRARQNFLKHGVSRPDDIRIEHELAEAVFDKQFLRGPRDTCSRQAVSSHVESLVKQGKPIGMVIPALPFKFSSPLKSRGEGPDLGEVNFLLSLLEIVWTVELLYKKARPDLSGPLAKFIVVSDGSRFAECIGEPMERLKRYRHGITQWINRLGVDDNIAVVDYIEELLHHLPEATLEAKASIAKKARAEYNERMWPIFQPRDMRKTLKVAKEVEPDPELNNHEGRFVTLLKSLIFTIDYRTLRTFAETHSPKGTREQYHVTLYRELTAHIFDSYVVVEDGLRHIRGTPPNEQRALSLSSDLKESLRIAMLTEAWQATIEYLAEIKSDRDLPADPILMVFPDCLRWTIHAKPGQLALLTSHALGAPIQCWAGSGVFRPTKGGKIRLCTLPTLALEGQGAIPVIATGTERPDKLSEQPLFYLDARIPTADVTTFLSTLDGTLTRSRSS